MVQQIPIFRFEMKLQSCKAAFASDLQHIYAINDRRLLIIIHLNHPNLPVCLNLREVPGTLPKAHAFDDLLRPILRF